MPCFLLKNSKLLKSLLNWGSAVWWLTKFQGGLLAKVLCNFADRAIPGWLLSLGVDLGSNLIIVVKLCQGVRSWTFSRGPDSSNSQTDHSATAQKVILLLVRRSSHGGLRWSLVWENNPSPRMEIFQPYGSPATTPHSYANLSPWKWDCRVTSMLSCK